MVLEESSICVSCLHKQIPFVSFLVGVRSNHLRLRSYRPILRPIFVVMRFQILIHSNIIQFINKYMKLMRNWLSSGHPSVDESIYARDTCLRL